jgi:hypothetical protein
MLQERFEDTKGAIGSKGQTTKVVKRIKTNNRRRTIYKALHIKLKIAQNLLTKGSRSKIHITLYLHVLSVSIFRKYP